MSRRGYEICLGCRSKNVRRRQLVFELLDQRELLAANVLVDEPMTFGTGVLSVNSNTGRSGIVLDDSGNAVFEDTFIEDETETQLGAFYGVADSIDVSFDVRFPDSIPVADISRGFGSVKLSRLVAPDVAARAQNMQNELSFYVEPDGSVQYSLVFFVEGSDLGSRIPVVLETEKRMSIRYFAQFNTPGESDGIWQVWINGEQVVDRSDIVFSSDATSRPERLWIGGNISFGGDDPSEPFRRQIDNVRVVVDGFPNDKTGSPQLRTEGGQIGLFIEGTDLPNNVLLEADESGKVDLRIDNVDHAFSDVDFIRIDTNAGNDFVKANSKLPLEIHVGSGDDYVFSKAATGVIFGGLGDDLLIADGGSQVVAGGTGGDTIVSYAWDAPHLLASGELATRADWSLFELEAKDDFARDRIFSIGYFAPLLLVDTLDAVYKWALRRR